MQDKEIRALNVQYKLKVTPRTLSEIDNFYNMVSTKLVLTFIRDGKFNFIFPLLN